MNRLVLIGNGFDLAHNLPTSYKDFINWYWDYRVYHLVGYRGNVSQDVLCKLTSLKEPWSAAVFTDLDLKHANGMEVYKHLIANKDQYAVELSPFFKNILQSIETKKWVDIEKEYYILLKDYIFNKNDINNVVNLNVQLEYIKEGLVEYLKRIDVNDKILNGEIRPKIYAPFNLTDFPGDGRKALKEHVEQGLNLDDKSLDAKFRQYGGHTYTSGFVDDYRVKYGNEMQKEDELPPELLLPNKIMLLTFNYTHTAQLYVKEGTIFNVVHIHGDINDLNSIIFGYGDEMDSDYKKIVNKDDNRLLSNIKQIKYHESDNYHKVYSFIESEPYQIVIMGHSCGISDRTLLNTLFEHKNCVSIKPYYYKRDDGNDNYIELVQNITRNFNEDKVMRNRMVEKPYCEPLTRL